MHFRLALRIALLCASFLALSVSAQSKWTWRNPLPQGNDLRSIASSGNLLVVVGQAGTILTSVDGINWSIESSGTTYNFYDVAWTGSRFIAVGEYGLLATSPDGKQWSVRHLGSTSTYSGEGKDTSYNFYSVAAAGESIYLSGDFTLYTSEESESGQWVSRDGGNRWKLCQECIPTSKKFPAPKDRVIRFGKQFLFSSNGVAWKRPPVNLRDGMYPGAIAWTGTRLVAAAYDDELHGYGDPVLEESQVFTSTNGKTWDSAALGAILTMRGAAAAGDSVMVAVGDEGKIFVSRDGHAWEARSSGESLFLNDVFWTGTLWIAIGYEGCILTSPDAMTWTRRSSGPIFDLNTVAWTGKQFVVVGDSGFLLSPDAKSWKVVPSRQAIGLKHVIWTGTRLVAVGDSGLIRTSLDGIQWYTRASGTRHNLRQVLWTGFLGIAVGDSGTILTSPDGANWTVRRTGLPEMLLSAAWTGIRIVVLGQKYAGVQCVVLTSEFGVDWTERRMEQDGFPGYVTWTGKNLFTSGGQHQTSPDGIRWKNHGPERGSEDVDGGYVSIDHSIWVGNQFVAYGDWANRLYVSPDAVRWKEVFVTNNSLNDILWTGDKIIAVGENGIILTSP
jgi:hypothetical protein